jgi:hypothetical protein
LDHFGIGAAVLGSVNTYFQSARRTGRTTALLESLKPGDRIICATSKEADILRRMIRERNLDVRCIVVPPSVPDKLFEHSMSQGRTIFDHTWLEQYYLARLKRMAQDIDHLQTQSSGYGEAHHRTRLAAKWHPFPPFKE